MEHPQERYWPEIIEDYASLDQGVEPCQMFEYTNLLERKTMLRSGLCPDRDVDPCQMRLLCSPQLHCEPLLLLVPLQQRRNQQKNEEAALAQDQEHFAENMTGVRSLCFAPC